MGIAMSIKGFDNGFPKFKECHLTYLLDCVDTGEYYADISLVMPSKTIMEI